MEKNIIIENIKDLEKDIDEKDLKTIIKNIGRVRGSISDIPNRFSMHVIKGGKGGIRIRMCRI